MLCCFRVRLDPVFFGSVGYKFFILARRVIKDFGGGEFVVWTCVDVPALVTVGGVVVGVVGEVVFFMNVFLLSWHRCCSGGGLTGRFH